MAIEVSSMDEFALGVLFDFGAWLTTRNEVLTCSSTHNAGPVSEAIQEFATMRGLSLQRNGVNFDWWEACGDGTSTENSC